MFRDFKAADCVIFVILACCACANASFRSGGARVPQAGQDGSGNAVNPPERESESAESVQAREQKGGKGLGSGPDAASGSQGNGTGGAGGSQYANSNEKNSGAWNSNGGNNVTDNSSGGNSTGTNGGSGNSGSGNQPAMNPQSPAPNASNAPNVLGPIDVQNLCTSLLNLGSQEKCRFPAQQIFGGSFQTGAVEILNPKTGGKSCPSGFRTFALASVNGVQPANRLELGSVSVSICLSEGDTATEVVSNSCPAGQSSVLFGNQKVCSDVAKRACNSLGGVFNAQAGTCQLKARETVYGGMFETGEAENAGTAKVINPDDQNKETEEKCETPNSFAGLNTCKCGTGFQAASSSNFAELFNGFDRFTYCFSAEKLSGLAPKVNTPQGGCSAPYEEKFKVGSEFKCLTAVADLCTTLGGNYQTTTGKCSLPGSTFFGGSFQIGFSDHRKFGPLLDHLKDPLLGGRPQFCESPNQKLSANLINSAAGCSCPAGFSRHALAMVEEPAEGDYDREYLCIAN